MNDGEFEISNHVLLPNSDSSSNIQASLSSDSLLDDLLRNAHTCTHTHTCNRPGPDAAHTHTCLHSHTRVIPPDEQSPISKPDRPLGNREAVRRYREKKKAHAAHLEEEVKKLRLLNQLLLEKLQKQTVLESEIVRLRTLLLNLRGKIDLELGDGRQCNSMNNFEEKECGVGENSACNFAGSSSVIKRRGETRADDCEANLTMP